MATMRGSLGAGTRLDRKGPRVSRTRIAFTLLVLAILPPGIAEAQSRAERAEAYLEAFHELRRFNGSALVIDRGRVLFDGALGSADLESGTPATRETRFRIASLTKHFTAALVLRLEEDGLLDTSATVAWYIDEYPRPQGDRITIHHLLTHTSGLPSYTDLPGFLDERAMDRMSPGEIAALTWGEPLRFDPGSRFEYSNSGYVLLGWIAERVTGRTYDELIDAYLLSPNGLADTGYDRDVTPPAGHARGFTRTLVGYEPARPLDPSLPYAAGMLYSTAGDLGRWTAALLGWGDGPGPFQRDDTLDRMLTPALDDYAYGLRVYRRPIGRDESVRVIEHTGGIFGFSAILRAFPDHERLIVLLDNTSSDLGPIAEGLTNLLWGAESEAPKPSIAERILPIVESAGVGPALERYRDWRRTRADRYDFGPGELMALARHFHELGDAATAIEILEAQVEDEPELMFSRFALSELHAEVGDTARAALHAEAALTYRPGVPQLLERLAELGREADAALWAPVVPVEPGDLVGLAGDYTIDPATTLTVEVVDGELLARRTGEPAFRLLPQSATTFLLHGSKVQLVFQLDGERAASVSIQESGQRVTFPRAR